MWETLNSTLLFVVVFLFSLLLFSSISHVILAVLKSSTTTSPNNFAIFQIPVSKAVLPITILTPIPSLSVLVPIISGAGCRPTGAQIISCVALVGTPRRPAQFLNCADN